MLYLFIQWRYANMNALFVVILMMIGMTYLYELFGVLGMVIASSIVYCACCAMGKDNI